MFALPGPSQRKSEKPAGKFMLELKVGMKLTVFIKKSRDVSLPEPALIFVKSGPIPRFRILDQNICGRYRFTLVIGDRRER